MIVKRIAPILKVALGLETEVNRLRQQNALLLAALKQLYGDSKEFHDFPDEEEHINCGWCMAVDALAAVEGK